MTFRYCGPNFLVSAENEFIQVVKPANLDKSRCIELDANEETEI